MSSFDFLFNFETSENFNLWFSEVGFWFVELDAIFKDGFLYPFDVFLEIINLVSSCIKSVKILLINVIDIVPVVDELFSVR